MASGTMNNNGHATATTLTWDQQSGTIKFVRSGKIRMLVFEDAKLPSSRSYFSPNESVPFSGSDSPVVLTPGVLLCGSGVMQLWVRTAGTIGQGGGVANSIVNGTVVWAVE